MPKANTLEICRKYLFENPKEKLSPQLDLRLKRIRGGFVYWTEFPMKMDFEIRDFLMEIYDVEKSQAYDDLTIIKMLLGNVKNASKQWHLYTFLEMAKETYQIAKDKLDPRAMAMVMGNYGKYTQLHIPDKEQIPWHEIIPQLIEPTEDPTVVGLVRDPDARKKAKKLLEKYSNEISDKIQTVHIEDIEFIDVSDDKKG
ncbi:MAG: hypothetical protein QM503_10705 [Bacteroidota bacterium]